MWGVWTCLKISTSFKPAHFIPRPYSALIMAILAKSCFAVAMAPGAGKWRCYRFGCHCGGSLVAKVMMNFSQEPHILLLLLLIWYEDAKVIQLTIQTRQKRVKT